MNRGFRILAALAAGMALSCGGERPGPQTATAIRVGYFPNVMHSQALLGLARGDFRRALGPGVTIEPKTFNAGPSVIEALFGGEFDLAYIGPNPAINGWGPVAGEALRIGGLGRGSGLRSTPRLPDLSTRRQSKA